MRYTNIVDTSESQHEPDANIVDEFPTEEEEPLFRKLNVNQIESTDTIGVEWRLRKGKQVPTAHKLLYGMMLTTAALLIMAVAGSMTDGGAVRVAGLWMAGFYFVITLGELCLSPIGLSLVTKLAPKRLVGLAMGGWFLAISIGNKFSGFLGNLQNYMEPMWFFVFLAGLAAAVAVFIFLVIPRLDKAITKYGA